MRRSAVIAGATWVLERLGPRRYSRTLAGDLIEELEAGRTRGWYCRQVAMVIGMTLLAKLRAWVLPLLFSMTWSALYPSWRGLLWTMHMQQSMFARSATMDWPYSALLRLGSGLLPAVTFVWLGFCVYLALLVQRTARLPAWHILGGLSLSLSVLLVATIGMLSWPGFSDGGGNLPAREIFAPSPAEFPFCVPLAVSLFAAIVWMPSALRQHRGAASAM